MTIRTQATGRKQRVRGMRRCSVLAAIVIATTACHDAALAGSGAAVAWRSDNATPRLTLDTVPRLPTMATGGFAVTGDDLYVADLNASRITELRRRSGQWRFIRDLPQHPGLYMPRTIAALAAGRLLAIFDAREQIQVTEIGSGLSIRVTPKLPCRIVFPQMTSGPEDALFLTGDCRGTSEADTAHGILAVSSDTGKTFRLIGQLPRYRTDGSWGSIVGARRFVTVTRESVAFGTGSEACLQRFTVRDLRRSPDDCTLPTTLYRSAPPTSWNSTEMAQLFRMHTLTATQWPNPLPRYIERIEVPAAHILLRLVNSQTVEFQTAGENAGVPLLIAPLDGFRGCGGEGCLWMIQRETATAMRLLNPSELDSLASLALRRRQQLGPTQ